MATEPEGFAHVMQYLFGQVYALTLFCAAEARTNPDREALLAEMDSAEQQGLAHIEATLLGDAALQGYRYLFDTVRKVLGDTPR